LALRKLVLDTNAYSRLAAGDVGGRLGSGRQGIPAAVTLQAHSAHGERSVEARQRRFHLGAADAERFRQPLRRHGRAGNEQEGFQAPLDRQRRVARVNRGAIIRGRFVHAGRVRIVAAARTCERRANGACKRINVGRFWDGTS
jgi:hypothetical protein